MEVARAITETHHVGTTGDLLLRHWRGGWWCWQDSCWVESENRAVRAELYKSTERATYVKPVKQGNGEVSTLEPWAPNRHKIADLAEALAAVLHLSERVSQPGWTGDAGVPAGVIVACANGLLNVENRMLYPHTPRYFNQTAVPFDYAPNAADPKRWLAFLDDLWPDDADSIRALQEFMGYVISGRLDLQKMLLLVGPTRAGKGVITRILGALVGRDNVAGPTLSSLGSDFGLAPLLGKPLAVISDARLNGHNNSVVVERLLSVSGEDTITVNRKYRDQWNGKLPTRFVLLSNELPHFGDASAAIIGRFVALQLQRSWLGHEDLGLEDGLHQELPGILNWVLDGLERLTLEGRFTRPAYTDDVLITLADLASPVAAFVRDRCERDPLLVIRGRDLYAAWKSWAEDNGHKAGTKQTLGRNLRAVVPGLRSERPRDAGERDRWYRGIALKGEH
jgi:putative DNA primase/helicase